MKQVRICTTAKTGFSSEFNFTMHTFAKSNTQTVSMPRLWSQLPYETARTSDHGSIFSGGVIKWEEAYILIDKKLNCGLF